MSRKVQPLHADPLEQRVIGLRRFAGLLTDAVAEVEAERACVAAFLASLKTERALAVALHQQEHDPFDAQGDPDDIICAGDVELAAAILAAMRDAQ